MTLKMMSESEYKKIHAQLTDDFNKARVELIKKYVSANAKYSKGDIIKSVSGMIRVEALKSSNIDSYGIPPTILYYGTLLTKNFENRKIAPFKGYIREIDSELVKKLVNP